MKTTKLELELELPELYAKELDRLTRKMGETQEGLLRRLLYAWITERQCAEVREGRKRRLVDD